MNLFRSVTVLLVLLLFTSVGQAKEIHVVTDIWQGYTNKDGTGYYLDILREIYPPPAYTLNVSYVPFKRSLVMIEEGKADICLGVYQGDIPDDLLAKHFVENDKVDAVVSKQIAKSWKGLKSLKNRRVVAKIGYGFDVNFTFPIDYSEKINLLSMMKMLKANRVDAVLDYEIDIKKHWQESGLDEQFTIINAVIANQAFFGFAKKEQELKAHFEKMFLALVQSGKILELGQKNSLDAARIPSSK